VYCQAENGLVKISIYSTLSPSLSVNSVISCVKVLEPVSFYDWAMLISAIILVCSGGLLGRKKRDVHSERVLQEALGGRFLEDKDWELEAAVGIGYIKISAWLGRSRTNVRIVPELAYSST
jgi:hypothetical protein